MKIDGFQVGKIQRKYLKQKKDVNERKNTKRKDSMNISSEAQNIKKIKQKLAQMPDIRKQKVEELKDSINKGEYKVNSRLVARNILSLIEQE